MAKTVLILIGTNKGAFILEGDAARRDWRLKGPFCEAWPINHFVGDPATGALYAGGGDGWFGAGVWRSDDLGATWRQSGEGLAPDAGEDGEEDGVESVWSLAAANGRLYAGVKPAGLFQSDDGGRTWRHLRGLRDHPSRDKWAAGGAGLVLHSIVADPADADRIWVGVSIAGVFQSEDGGATWTPRNRGTRCDFLPEGEDRYPEVGQCVHGLARAAGPGDRLYQQNHCGMYRSDDGGREWVSIEAGLPSNFGFPAAAHPTDPNTAFLIPLNGEEGRYMPDARAAVWRTRDGGATWADLRRGLPQENVYFCVLRQAMATDRLTPAGVYFGANSGALYASADEGESWRRIAEHLPLILSVETLEVG